MTTAAGITLNSTRRGILTLMLAVFLFTAMDATAKGMLAIYPLPQVVWARFVGQLLIVLIYLGPRSLPALRTRHPFWHLVRSVTQFGSTALFFGSLYFIGLAEATALADINPVLITLGAALFLGEPLRRSRVLGVLLAMVGALIVIRPGSGIFTPAALLPLATAVTYAINVLVTRHIGRRETPWASMIYAAAFGAALSSLALPWGWEPIALQDAWRFALLALLGAGAQLCIIRAFALAEASVLAPFAYCGILFATFWGMLLYGEFPDLWTVVGALVIVVSGLYVWAQDRKAALLDPDHR
jgi:drug/metabolite transporter (DMT)-like permease